MIGGGIFLIVVGAIVRYALNLDIGGIEEGTLGWILIAAGIVLVVLGLIAAPFQLWMERRRTVVVDDPDAGYRTRPR